MIVDVICAAGHRFSGPSEMLEGTNELGAWGRADRLTTGELAAAWARAPPFPVRLTLATLYVTISLW